MVGVGEINVAHQVEGLVVVSIESEVLQQQVAADDTDGVVVEAHPDAVGLTDEIGVFHVDLTIDQRMPGSALDVQLAFAEALEADQLVRHKTIGQ